MEKELIQKPPVVYIVILGIGSNTKSYSKFNREEKSIIELVEYGTEGNIKDVKALFSDVKQLKKGNELVEKQRLTNLFELLKFYLLSTNLNINVIGFSHGSLIIHGAILKLKMIIDDKLEKRLNSNSITIITVGSPRYLPKELLRENKIYNLYNIEDFLKNIKWFFKPYFKIPTFPNTDDIRFKFNIGIGIKQNKNAEIHSFIDDENFIFVKFIGFRNYGYLYYHGSLNNIFVFFIIPFPQVINYFLYDRGEGVINFDKNMLNSILYL